MFLRIVTVALLALCTLSSNTARADTPADFSGTWWSERCSKVDLKVGAGGLLSGSFSSPGVPTPYPVTGFRTGNDLIAFSVSFGGSSIASWTGQHTLIAGTETIMTMWHLAQDVPDDQELLRLWSSNLTGYDNFRRGKPAYCA